jgi:O-antigen ligase
MLYMAGAISAIAALVLPPRLAVALLVFLLPANRLLTIGPVSVLLIMILVLFARSLGSIIGRRLEPKQSGTGTFPAFAFALVLFSFTPHDGGLPLVLQTTKTILTLWTLWAVFEADRKLSTTLSWIVHAGVGVVSAALLSLAFRTEILEEDLRLSVTEEGGENALATAAAVILFLLILAVRRRQIRAWYLLGLLAAGVAAVGLMTASRGFLLGLTIGLAVLLIHDLIKLDYGSIGRGIVLGVTTAGTIWLLGLWTLAPRLELVIDRVINPKNDDISNGRLDIWADYIDYFRQNPFELWAGVGNYTKIANGLAAHNAILEDIAAYGLIGLMIILGTYFSWLFALAKPGAGTQMASAVPMLVLFSVSMASHTILGLPSTILLFLCAASLRHFTKSPDAGNDLASRSTRSSSRRYL